MFVLVEDVVVVLTVVIVVVVVLDPAFTNASPVYILAGEKTMKNNKFRPVNFLTPSLSLSLSLAHSDTRACIRIDISFSDNFLLTFAVMDEECELLIRNHRIGDIVLMVASSSSSSSSSGGINANLRHTGACEVDDDGEHENDRLHVGDDVERSTKKLDCTFTIPQGN